MPRNISKQCPGCGKVETMPKVFYKITRKVFSGSRCHCGFERRWESQWARRERKKRKPRFCDCGCGHQTPCIFPKIKAVPDMPIKCTIPDCLSSASVGFQRRIQEGFGEEDRKTG